ncbi:MAG: hypothetical protein GY854_18360 [Deltaproteobacteria bacterium]|nr:hypothetical protein [Deltaproteobacteria bacterium]
MTGGIRLFSEKHDKDRLSSPVSAGYKENKAGPPSTPLNTDTSIKPAISLRPKKTSVLERWVLCGNAPHSKTPEDTLRLSVTEPNKNLKLYIRGISAPRIAGISPLWKDLLSIATYVFAAERIYSLGYDTEATRMRRRHFRYLVGVRCPEFWSVSRIRKELERVLFLLSGHAYTFMFRPVIDGDCGFSLLPRPTKPSPGERELDDVLLLSGGLDSLGGAVDQILKRNKRAALVSHCSSTLAWQIQSILAYELQRRIEAHPIHVTIRVIPIDNQYRKERPQPASAFLHVVLAGIIAHLAGLDRVCLYANGVSSQILPLTPPAQGIMPVPAAHPHVLAAFSRLLSAVAETSFKIENPFEHKTRTEIIHRIKNCEAEALIHHTASCRSSPFSSRVHHCGVCPKCIDRRFAMIAAGHDEHDADYAIGLTSREWEQRERRSRLLKYAAAGYRFASAKDLQGFRELLLEPGRSAAHVNQAAFELHRRHGQTIGDVIELLSNRIAQQALEGRLPTHKSTILLCAQGLRSSTSPPKRLDDTTHELKISPLGKYVFTKSGDIWVARFGGGDTFEMTPHKGYSYVQYLLSHPNYIFTAFQLIDIIEGRDTSCRPFAIALETEQKTCTAIRKAKLRLIEEVKLARKHGDKKKAVILEAELKLIVQYLNSERPMGRSRKETKQQHNARNSVSNSIRRAIKKILPHSRPMAKHLTAYIRTGFFTTYRCGDILWEV